MHWWKHVLLIHDNLKISLALLLLAASCAGIFIRVTHSSFAQSTGPVQQAFEQAARSYGVPADLLKAICYMEGNLSDHEGSPSIDNGFGCMHLAKNEQTDTLDRAARELGVSVRQVEADLPTTIRGGAIILRDDALQLSRTHQLPHILPDWYGSVAVYSNATTRETALMYADTVYSILDQGFSVQADDGETITLQPQSIRPNLATTWLFKSKGPGRIPAGCKSKQHTDYPGAIACILKPRAFDCNIVPTTNCTFTGANRPTRSSIYCIVIHDIEGNAFDALSVFENPRSKASAHYVIDNYGTVYQVVREKDIAYHAGNFWYNRHSIGIEHTGFDASGFKWYNATEYLASARLTAYLLKKYHIPLDHAHVISHGSVPIPFPTRIPNHEDPGPYWLWDYYLQLIHRQGVPFPKTTSLPAALGLHPSAGQRPFGKHGRETSANFTFYYLYRGPGTSSGRIDRATSITDINGTAESDMSYYPLARVIDPAGSGKMMYEIWYGEIGHTSTGKIFYTAQKVWLAVPPGTATVGRGTPVTLTNSHPQIYGQPTSHKRFVIGTAPRGATFISAYRLTEDRTKNLWYEINYNHRQAWIPTTEIAPGGTASPPNP